MKKNSFQSYFFSSLSMLKIEKIYLLHLFLHLIYTFLVSFFIFSFYLQTQLAASEQLISRSASQLINSRRFKHAVSHEIRVSCCPGVSYFSSSFSVQINRGKKAQNADNAYVEFNGGVAANFKNITVRFSLRNLMITREKRLC